MFKRRVKKQELLIKITILCGINSMIIKLKNESSISIFISIKNHYKRCRFNLFSFDKQVLISLQLELVRN